MSKTHKSEPNTSHTKSKNSKPQHNGSPKPRKSERNILIAFLLNLGFSIYEFIGGSLTGSVAIVSDAVHDIGDAMSIGLSYFLELRSKRRPDPTHTYGYLRYSVLGSLITTVILLLGSIFVITSAISRIIHPVEIHYDGMIILAIIGAVVNFAAAYFTREGDSLNQKSVNLHMLEDVLGWVVVLIGAIVIRSTNFSYIDPILSIIVAGFIFWQALANFQNILNVFLEKTPRGVSLDELRQHLLKIDGITDVHHVHVWSMDGFHNYATLHVVTDQPISPAAFKRAIRAELAEHGINHSTIELETPDEHCHDDHCEIQPITAHPHEHHHKHHH